ncbi:nuclear transport factor 2 family protein [Spiroplasma endosymbiont of Aspidapion aeneum]|uniref:nuclear transport factor 2 family protein n=1 Tax=Spiroplasma endosymbiont of Aspidapion aeneum TaxID=3066276 RepID=UPI00313A88B9
MSTKQIINEFYSAFKKGDYQKMNSLYGEDIIFNDSIFKDLDYLQVTSMWEMLLSKKEESKFSIEYEVLLDHNDEYYVMWSAHYLFGPKRRKVSNIVKSEMVIKDKKIALHTDVFDFYKWSKQAIGIASILFGKRKFFHNKICSVANKNLMNYISNKDHK